MRSNEWWHLQWSWLTTNPIFWSAVYNNMVVMNRTLSLFSSWWWQRILAPISHHDLKFFIFCVIGEQSDKWWGLRRWGEAEDGQGYGGDGQVDEDVEKSQSAPIFICNWWKPWSGSSWDMDEKHWHWKRMRRGAFRLLRTNASKSCWEFHEQICWKLK